MIVWKYKESLIYVPNIKLIEWMVSKVQGRGPIDLLPPPFPPSPPPYDVV